MTGLRLAIASARGRLRFGRVAATDAAVDGRARERHRRMAMTAGAAALAKGFSVGAALISVPLTLHYLGAERFGMWMTISSVIAMLSFADFGIANGVLSAVATAYGRDDNAGIARAISSGLFMLLAIALAVLALFAGVYAWVPWPRVFNVVSPEAVAEAGPALAVVVTCFAASIPLALVQRAQFGMQRGFLASLWQCAGSVLALVGVLTAIHLEAGLPWLGLALAGAPLLASLTNSLVFFGISRRDLLPRWRLVSRATCTSVAGTGALFFLLQLVAAVAYTSDSIVIAQVHGAEAVAAFAVPEKLFGFVGLMIGMVLAPLWPAYGEAIARGDAAWVRHTLQRSLLIGTVCAAVLSALLVLFGPQLIHLWVRDAITPAFGLLVALGVWKVVEVAGGALAMFLNGAGVVRLQVVCAIATACVAVALKLLLVPSLGPQGAVWASVVAYLCFTALPIGLRLPALVRLVRRPN